MTNLLEHQAKKAGDELEERPNWRQKVFCLYWDTLYTLCAHCGLKKDCLLRVARLSNGWEARDLACVHCRHTGKAVMEQGKLMYSPEQLAEERRLEGHMRARDARQHTLEARIRAVFEPQPQPEPRQLPPLDWPDTDPQQPLHPPKLHKPVPRYFIPPDAPHPPPPKPSLWRRFMLWLSGHGQ